MSALSQSRHSDRAPITSGQNLVNLLGIPSSLNFAVSGSVNSISVLADQEYADFRERRERLRRLADGGAAAPVEPAIDAANI